MTEPKKKTSNSKKAFVFFNCDGNKSEQSMNIFYNHIVYKDTQASRKLLWSKIQNERKENRIQISDDNLAEVKRLILEDDPVQAGNYIMFGAIKVVDCF